MPRTDSDLAILVLVALLGALLLVGALMLLGHRSGKRNRRKITNDYNPRGMGDPTMDVNAREYRAAIKRTAPVAVAGEYWPPVEPDDTGAFAYGRNQKAAQGRNQRAQAPTYGDVVGEGELRPLPVTHRRSS